ncbi:CopD family protein, partial [Bacillus cereus]|uniref:CopD family protein n=6 Tax=Bacteria TaxID=2 RepID=UPI0035FA5797
LVPLALILVRTSGPDAVLIARRFSLVGIAAVTVILGSAAPLAWTWIGNLGGWFGTDYGLWAIAKLVGLLLLLLLAALNRVALTPRLAAPAAHTAMLVSIGLEAIMGLAVIIAAVHLATLPPGAHEKPQWPFPVRPDLRRIDEPFIRLEIERAAIIG